MKAGGVPAPFEPLGSLIPGTKPHFFYSPPNKDSYGKHTIIKSPFIIEFCQQMSNSPDWYQSQAKQLSAGEWHLLEQTPVLLLDSGRKHKNVLHQIPALSPKSRKNASAYLSFCTSHLPRWAIISRQGNQQEVRACFPRLNGNQWGNDLLYRNLSWMQSSRNILKWGPLQIKCNF